MRWKEILYFIWYMIKLPFVELWELRKILLKPKFYALICVGLAFYFIFINNDLIRAKIAWIAFFFFFIAYIFVRGEWKHEYRERRSKVTHNYKNE